MEVRFELPDPAYEAYIWEYDNEFLPGAQAPLTRTLLQMDFGSGEDVPGTVSIGGYSYSRAGASDWTPAKIDDGMTALERWREKWLPQVESAIAEMKSFSVSDVPDGGWTARLGADVAEYRRIFFGVHLETVLQAGFAARAFIETFKTEFGEDREQDAHALMHGFPNATVRRSEALWDLSRIVRGDEPLLASLRAWPEKGGHGRHHDFERAFRAFLGEHGGTVDGNLLDLPTWVEDPTPVAQIIIKYAAMPDGSGPSDVAARTAARRRELEEEVENDGSDALKGQLVGAQERVIVGEDHNVLSDQAISAASRMRWLSVGERLVEIGGASDRDQVFLYGLEELGAALDGGSVLDGEELEGRQETLSAYRAATPPRRLGKQPDEPGEDTGGSQTLLQGMAASPGILRGRARLARTIDDAQKLEPGDVLVAPMTMPAWTPFFAIAGAVVTDAGGPLSHPAVVAREFGIPAVVAVGDATKRIRDGQVVIVDGSAGTVELAPE